MQEKENDRWRTGLLKLSSKTEI